MADAFAAFGDDSSSDDEAENTTELNASTNSSSIPTKGTAETVIGWFQRYVMMQERNRGDGYKLVQQRICILIDTSSTSDCNDIAVVADDWIQSMTGRGIVSKKHQHDIQVVDVASQRREEGNDVAAFRFDICMSLIPVSALSSGINDGILSYIVESLIPGGYFLVCNSDNSDVLDDFVRNYRIKNDSLRRVWYQSISVDDGDGDWYCIEKIAVQIQHETCPWLPATPSDQHEYELLRSASVSTSMEERCTGQLHSTNIRNSVDCLRRCGYCVIPGVGDTDTCQEYGQAILQDIHTAAGVLKSTNNVDLYRPPNNSSNDVETNDLETYRELSMREECRMDLRHGPALNSLRGTNDANQSITVTATETERKADFLRGNRTILEIVRTVMNPKHGSNIDLYTGNFGRYNFNGSGPDGSFQDICIGVVGGIVSLPGAADQAIHADTPHLFEHCADPLPPHYINLFTPGCPPADNVGQTAFIHGSHRLDFVSEHLRSDDDIDGQQQHQQQHLSTMKSSIWRWLVRPRLNMGDVVIFDCRMLHFGLANRSTSIERPVLYMNITMHWFHDPKNWDKHKSLFPSTTNNEEE